MNALHRSIPLPPRTGNQYTITHGEYQATITQLGATLRQLTWRGIDVVVPLEADDIVSCCHGQILIPFPNRIAQGKYTFENVTYELPIDEHERQTAIHGYGYRCFWELVSLSNSSVTLAWRPPNMKGYPFNIITLATWSLQDDGLFLSLATTNYDHIDAPWAAAIHPWISNGFHAYGDDIDALNAQCLLSLPAETHVTVDDNLIPTGTQSVDGTPYDLRNNVALVNQPFDDAWTNVHHDADGWTMATLTRPDGMQVSVGGDQTITSFQVCTGTGFPPPEHPCGVAVEPQTAYANAFNTGTDLIHIHPGETCNNNFRIVVVQGPSCA